jgi:transcription initiation factor IIE alpha subunit
LYNINIERKIRKKVLSRKLRKLSSSKIFISKGEFKHTNNKVIITLYVFNKQKINYLFKLKKRYLNKFFKNILTFKKANVIYPGEEKLANKLILLKKLNKISLHGFKVIEQAN